MFQFWNANKRWKWKFVNNIFCFRDNIQNIPLILVGTLPSKQTYIKLKVDPLKSISFNHHNEAFKIIQAKN